MPLLQLLRPTLPILIGASLMLSLSMGLRQSLGIFLQPLTHDVGISVADFTLAIAVQNLAWGFLQPFAGALTVRIGFRAIMVGGAFLYVAGLSLLATASGFFSILVGAGVLIGMSLACTAAAIAMSVATRAVPASVRSTVLGMVSGAGSLGALIAAPIGQVLNQGYGWRIGLASFVLMSLALLPAENATGNFVKVVQRLPVRIELEDYDPNENALFIGTSVVPYVYVNKPATGPDAGKFLQTSSPASPTVGPSRNAIGPNK